MKRLIILGATCAFLAGCGSGGSDNTTTTTTTTPPLDVTGTWKGAVNSSVTGAATSTLVLAETGTNVTGSYSTTSSVTGDMVGTLNSTIFTFSLTPTMAHCTGALSGTGTITTPTTGQPTMSFTYSGTTSCGGAESGTGSLTKQ